MYSCFDVKKPITDVQSLYDYAAQNNKPLLSNFSAPFWVKYVADYKTYDRLFLRLYRTFCYYYGGADKKEIADEFSNFSLDVLSWLTANEKRYTELFRMENIDDDVYNILDNYDMTEKLTRTTSSKNTETLGSREDIERTERNLNDTTTETLDTTNTDAKTGDETIKKDITHTNAYAQVKTETLTNTPERINMNERDVMAYDSESYSPAERTTETLASVETSTSTTTGEHTDTLADNGTDTHTYNTTDTIKTSGTNTTSVEHTGDNTVNTTIGQQENNTTGSGKESYELTRKGNIGVMTQSDVLLKHLELWSGYEFYTKIFGDIANELLFV